MAILNQNSQSQTFFAGWYGTCETECENLNISTSSFRDKIYKIFQIRSDNLTYVGFDGDLSQNLDEILQPFSEFECGKYYIIILKSGTGQVDLPHFKEVDNESTDAGRVTQNCGSVTSNYEIYDPSDYLPGQAKEGLHKEIYLRTTDGTPLGDGPFRFKITGFHITSNDFDGWKNDSLQGTYTQFNENLDNGYFEGSGTSQQTYIELGIKADEESEGDETFRISLIDYPDVYLDVTIDDTSRDPEITLSSQGKQFSTEPNTTPKVIQGYDILVDCNFTSLDGDFTWEISSTDGVTFDDIDKVVLLNKGNDYSDLEFLGTLTGTWTQGTEPYAGIRIYPTLHSTPDATNPKTITLKVTNISTGTNNSIDIEVYENPPVYAEMTTYTQDGSLTVDQTLTFDLSFNISGGNLLASGDEGLIQGTVFDVPFKITGDFGIYYANSDLENNELVIEKYMIDLNTSEFVWRNYTDYAGSGSFTPNENGEVILTLPAVGGSLPPSSSGTSDYFQSIDDTVTASFRISFKSGSVLAGKTLNVELVNSGELTTGPTSHTYTGYVERPSELVLSAIHTELDEGFYVNNITFTEISLSTSDGTPLNPGDTHKIKLTGSGITPDDFKWSYWSDEYNYFEFDSSMEADFVVDNNRYADGIILTTKADSTTEGPETVRVILVDDPNVFVDIDINDTSTTPPTYTAIESYSNVNEGYPLTINVSTTNVDDDTELWWTIESNSGDFDVSSGSFFINNNSGSFTVTPTADATTEDGIETFTVAIRTGSVNGDKVAETNSITINDTSTTPISYSLHIVDDGYFGVMGEVGDDFGFPNQKVIELRGVGAPLNTVVPFTISGSGITPEDFIGLDSLGAGEFILDSAGQGYNFGRVTLTTNADNSTEGTEVFTLYLDEDQSVSVEVSIYDNSRETFPGTLTLWPHSAGAEDPAYSPSMYEPLVNDSTADMTHFIAEISNWSGGQQTLQWEIVQNISSTTYGIVGADDVQYEPHNPEAYNYNQEFGITINPDGVSGTWPIGNTNYSALRIWVLADSVSEGVEGNSRELLRLKVTDENGNVSQVDVWVDERP